MSANIQYPLLLKPVIKDYLWGGTRLKTEYNYETDKEKAAEAWVLSCHKDGSDIVENGELAGNCSLASQGDKRRTKHRCCVSIALYEKYCNLGLGRLLLNTLLGLAKQCGYTQAELGVIEGNERAKHVYESLGFKEYGFLPNSLRYSDGTTRGEYFMVKEL